MKITNGTLRSCHNNQLHSKGENRYCDRYKERYLASAQLKASTAQWAEELFFGRSLSSQLGKFEFTYGTIYGNNSSVWFFRYLKTHVNSCPTGQSMLKSLLSAKMQYSCQWKLLATLYTDTDVYNGKILCMRHF